jgi:hypothetical protein
MEVGVGLNQVFAFFFLANVKILLRRVTWDY